MKLGRRGGGEKDACLSRRLRRQHDPHYFGHEGILSIKKNVFLIEPFGVADCMETFCTD